MGDFFPNDNFDDDMEGFDASPPTASDVIEAIDAVYGEVEDAGRRQKALMAMLGFIAAELLVLIALF